MEYKKLTTSEVTKMCYEYQNDKLTLKQIAKKHGVSPPTVRKNIAARGVYIRPSHKLRRYNLAMLINDWNADQPTERILRVYGLKSAKNLYQDMYELRKKGYQIKSRG